MNFKNTFATVSILFVAGVLHAMAHTAVLSEREPSTGERVRFLIEGKLYDGYLAIDAEERMHADIISCAETPLGGDRYDGLLDAVHGYRVPAHQDVGLDVYMLGTRAGIAFRYGIIEEVYDNGYHKIGVYSESYHNGATIHLFKPDYLIIHKAVLLQDGGFGILN